ncbi:alpha/beta fold hydrolase [Salipiger sp. H15]|uniref:Alpha/beta fold hydrolase n=1 Tax=Alloyangia sp. H15 TaxID=3029062 RepID=A0AAU8AHH9_9RHOB
MFELVEFPSEGAILRGRHYAHADGAGVTLVMAHGTSATVPMAMDAYAEAFFAAGYDVLAYDHRGFGASGGEPRQEINPWTQGRGYRDAVAYLRRGGGAGRIALWGDSYSAMVVLVAGALIEEIGAIVAQIPACGASLPGEMPEGAFELLRETFAGGDVSGGPGETTGPLPVVSFDQAGTPSLLTPIQAFRWFIEYGGRFGTLWQNRVTRVIPATPVPFTPWITAPRLVMPVLVMVGRGDEMPGCDPEVQRAVYARIPGRKSFHEIDGGHFGLLWTDGPLFEEAAAAQVGFLRTHLPPSVLT